MKNRIKLMLVALLLPAAAICQDYEIQTLFKSSSYRASGGYGAVVNKFTRIDGQFANMVEAYGGWYINHKFLVGVSGGSLTNNFPVPEQFSVSPGENMSYQYGQFGLMLEYTLWSQRAIHLSFHSFNGPGFTVQYRRYDWDDDFPWDDEFEDYPHDSNWFFVSEPGVSLEMNLFKWLRFSPGISYRAVFNSKAAGLSDKTSAARRSMRR